MMELEIKEIAPLSGGDFPPEGATHFSVGLRIGIGERAKPGAEAFHFIVASPAGLEDELGEKGFRHMRGLILMAEFKLATVHGATENLINHVRSLNTWDEVVRFFNRYGLYDSEDLDGVFYP